MVERLEVSFGQLHGRHFCILGLDLCIAEETGIVRRHLFGRVVLNLDEVLETWRCTRKVRGKNKRRFKSYRAVHFLK